MATDNRPPKPEPNPLSVRLARLEAEIQAILKGTRASLDEGKATELPTSTKPVLEPPKRS